MQRILDLIEATPGHRYYPDGVGGKGRVFSVALFAPVPEGSGAAFVPLPCQAAAGACDLCGQPGDEHHRCGAPLGI